MSRHVFLVVLEGNKIDENQSSDDIKNMLLDACGYPDGLEEQITVTRVIESSPQNEEQDIKTDY